MLASQGVVIIHTEDKEKLKLYASLRVRVFSRDAGSCKVNEL